MRRVNLDEFEDMPEHMKTMQSLYIYMWMKEENNKSKRLNFRIPHTILIKDNSISYWIFSDKQSKKLNLN